MNSNNLWKLLKLAGAPGFILIGYDIIRVALARQKADFASVDSTAIVFALYAMVGGVYCYNYVKKHNGGPYLSALFRKTPLFYFILYTALCFVSAIWSPIPILTAYRAAECIGMMMLIVATIYMLSNNTDTETVLEWSSLYTFINIGISFLGALKNGATMIEAVESCQFKATIFVYFAVFYSPRWWMKWIQILFAILSRSTTGYIGMALGLGSLGYGTGKAKICAAILFVGFIAAMVVMGPERLLNETIFSAKGGLIRNGQIDMSKSSGRDNIWQSAIEKVSDEGHVVNGYGFVAGETAFAHEFIHDNVIGMHNGFLSSYVGTGIFGLILFSIFFVGYSRWAFFKDLPPSVRSLLMASFCTVFLHTLGNPGLGFRVYGNWMPSMYIVVLTFTVCLQHGKINSYR